MSILMQPKLNKPFWLLIRMKIYKGPWRNQKNCTAAMHITLIGLLWTKTWMMHWMSSRNALMHSALSRSGCQSAGYTNHQLWDVFRGFSTLQNEYYKRRAKRFKAEIFLLRRWTYCSDSIDLLSIFHILVNIFLTSGHYWDRHKRLCLLNTKEAWQLLEVIYMYSQRLLYLIKGLANLPSTSITQWCSLHYFTILPYNINKMQTKQTRTKPQNLDTDGVLLCVDMPSCFKRTFINTSLCSLNYFLSR